MYRRIPLLNHLKLLFKILEKTHLSSPCLRPGLFQIFISYHLFCPKGNIQKRSCFISDKDEIAPWFHFTLRAHLPSSFLLHNVQDPCRTTHFFRFTRPASGRTSKTLVSGSFQPHLSAILCETILIFYFFRSKPFSVSVCSSLCKFFSFVKQISAGSTC